MEIYNDKYTKPKLPKPYIADNSLLKTNDIAGATSSESTVKFKRTEYRNTNFIGDIEGSKADSVKHTIITNRMTNPLNPVYQSLDPNELLEPITLPLVPETIIKNPTIKPGKNQSNRDKNTALEGKNLTIFFLIKNVI